MDKGKNYIASGVVVGALTMGTLAIEQLNNDFNSQSPAIIEQADDDISLDILGHHQEPLEICNEPEVNYIEDTIYSHIGFAIPNGDNYDILGMDECLRANYLAKIEGVVLNIGGYHDLEIEPGMELNALLAMTNVYQTQNVSLDEQYLFVTLGDVIIPKDAPGLEILNIQILDTEGKRYIPTNYSIVLKVPVQKEQMQGVYIKPKPSYIIGIIDLENQYTLTVDNIENPTRFSNYYAHTRNKDKNNNDSDTLGEH